MFKRYFIIITLSILTIIGCGHFDSEYTSIVGPDEVSTLRVSCVNFLGVPTMCVVINQTTRMIRIETIVTNIVDRIVEKEVVTEVPVEQIVKRVEIRYIVTGKEVNIKEIVKYVIARIKEYVQPTDIIEVPTDVIVDETTDSIVNAPPPDNVTTLGDIRDEKPPPPPQEDKEEILDPNSEDDGTDGDTKDGGSEGSTPPENVPRSDRTDGGTNNGGSEEGSTPGSTPGSEDPNGGSSDGDSEDDGTNNGGPEAGSTPGSIPGSDDTDGSSNDEGSNGGTTPGSLLGPDNTDESSTEVTATEKLQVRIGPKRMASSPSISQPGLSIGITCEIDGNTIHPSMHSFSVFRESHRKEWGVEVWCNVPSGLSDAATTISVNVNDFSRWCGLTTGDVSVSKFFQDPNGSPHGGGSVAAGIELYPDPVPVCNNNNAPMFTEGTHTTRSVVENTASGEAIGTPVSATDEDGDTLEYTLGGTDAGSFSIDNTTGQLRTSAALDYETQNAYSVSVTVSDNNGGTDTIEVDINVNLRKQEFFEVYYAIYLDSGFLDVQCYTIRGYGYDDGAPIYVDNYHGFEGGSPEQTSTGWGSATETGTIAYHLETGWKEDYPEEFDYVHAYTKVSAHDRTADEARQMIYQTICSAASAMGTWDDSYQAGLTYPEIANNTSNDVIDLDTFLPYLGDDDCNPNN